MQYEISIQQTDDTTCINYSNIAVHIYMFSITAKPQINHDKGLRSLVTVTGSDITISCNTSGKPVPNVAMTWNKTAGQYKLIGLFNL